MSKIFHLPTFSVNPQPTDYKQKRIIKLISQVNESNRDTLGEAFIRIMEGKKPNSDCSALNKYASTYKKCQILEEARKQTVSLEEQFEEAELKELSGNIPTVSFEDELITKCDTEYMVRRFLDLRQAWYYEVGHDILRLLELALLDEDIQARWKLQLVFREQQEMDFLKEFLQNPYAVEKIKDFIRKRKNNLWTRV